MLTAIFFKIDDPILVGPTFSLILSLEIPIYLVIVIHYLDIDMKRDL